MLVEEANPAAPVAVVTVIRALVVAKAEAAAAAKQGRQSVAAVATKVSQKDRRQEAWQRQCRWPHSRCSHAVGQALRGTPLRR
jgi:hypothetical protein